MIISVVWGKSEGSTTASALDGSLCQAGLHNLNLIRLSSVIPPGASVREVGIYSSQRRVGDICYAVLSSFSNNKAGTEITAGLGWVQTKHGGLFCESYGAFNSNECAEQINKGLKEMLSARGWSGEINMQLVTHVVEKVANVTVAAVYDSGTEEPMAED